MQIGLIYWCFCFILAFTPSVELLSLFLCGFLENMLRNTRSLGNCIFSSFTFSHILSLCLHLSPQCSKTPQPPLNGYHSNHLPTLNLYVDVCLCMYVLGVCLCVNVSKSLCSLRDVIYWKSVHCSLASPPWGFFPLISSCLCYTQLHTQEASYVLMSVGLLCLFYILNRRCHEGGVPQQ